MTAATFDRDAADARARGMPRTCSFTLPWRGRSSAKPDHRRHREPENRQQISRDELAAVPMIKTIGAVIPCALGRFRTRGITGDHSCWSDMHRGVPGLRSAIRTGAPGRVTGALRFAGSNALNLIRPEDGDELEFRVRQSDSCGIHHFPASMLVRHRGIIGRPPPGSCGCGRASTMRA